MSAEAGQALWDAIVIGTGIGGGTIGRALAEGGQTVLFLEQGAAGFRSDRAGLSDTPLPEARLTRGLWPEPLHIRLNGQDSAFFAPLGAGVGGSSVFYAATLERPEPHDLDDRPGLPHPAGGWPVGFDAMAPWFDVAARLYRLSGTDDPLGGADPLPLVPPPAATPVEASLMESLAQAGLHPYRAHTAIDRQPGCLSCLGHKCPMRCKMDGRSAGVEPALATGRATLIDRAEVLRLHADGRRVTGVEARVHGQVRTFRARRVVLSGGALGSPRLLLASASGDWPDGLANRSGLVGRNLMFHVNQMVALWPRRGTADGTTKGIAFRDLYHDGGTRFGTVQAMGIPAGYGEIVHYLSLMLARSRVAGVPLLIRAAAALSAGLLGRAQVFVGLMEDLPYPDNRVTFDPAHPGRLSVEYRFHPELIARHRAFRRAIHRALRGHRRIMLGLGPELNWGHPCGTLRFGADPARSVLNPDCRAHDLENLWVVDASFMPSSMGVNPSLTIAANALRVADVILKEPMP
ncbi:GMC oxidoreductase [Thetidibacter halocola]|uniref:GMC family oxidoreductase n=1 Tax=Thetidibacter halocola TaxID=2827239 RepID=A0A8J8B757_9RHOB|nr:GMC family oxidoreductase [Thetidibacter halocola]MBS0123379.1 GMC family oxidoreductase [Thetidibacter halocola]